MVGWAQLSSCVSFVCWKGSAFDAVITRSAFPRSWSLFFRTAYKAWVSMCIGILNKWLSIHCLKHLDELSETMKMCSLTIEVQRNYYVQRRLHGCSVMFSIIPNGGLPEINLTEKSGFRTFSRGSSESSRRALLVFRNTIPNHSRNMLGWSS